MSKTLNLTLTKKWFDMILSGEKKEEYREIKPYWCNRLLWHEYHGKVVCINSLKDALYAYSEDKSDFVTYPIKENYFDIIRFTNGYGKSRPSFDIELRGIPVGKGNPDWGGSNTDVFILKLGNIISRRNTPS